MGNQEIIVAQQSNDLRTMLKKMTGEFAVALPKHVTPEKLMRVVMTTVRQNPKLLDCNRDSFLSCVMTCAQLGLLPEGVMGHAYLIPFNKGYGRDRELHCQLIIGYKGYIALARQSGEIENISARVVYDTDHFEYEYGLHEKCEHRPNLKQGKKITHVYAVASFKEGGHAFDVMTLDQVETIMKTSKGYIAAEKSYNGKKPSKNSVWHLHFAEMARKTAVRRLSKYLPMDVQKATSIEDAYEAGKAPTITSYGEVIVEDDKPAIEAPRPVQGQEDKPTEETEPDTSRDKPGDTVAKEEPEKVPDNQQAVSSTQSEEEGIDEFPFDPKTQADRRLSPDEMIETLDIYKSPEEVRYFVHMHQLFMGEYSTEDHKRVIGARDKKIKDLKN